MICSKCGMELSEGSVSCPRCGQEVQIVSEKNILEDDILRVLMDDRKSPDNREEESNLSSMRGEHEQSENESEKGKEDQSKNQLVPVGQSRRQGVWNQRGKDFLQIAGNQIQKSGNRFRKVMGQFQNPGEQIQKVGERIRKIAVQRNKPQERIPMIESRPQKPESRSQETESRSQEVESRSRKSENQPKQQRNRNQKVKSRDQKRRDRVRKTREQLQKRRNRARKSAAQTQKRRKNTQKAKSQLQMKKSRSGKSGRPTQKPRKNVQKPGAQTRGGQRPNPQRVRNNPKEYGKYPQRRGERSHEDEVEIRRKERDARWRKKRKRQARVRALRVLAGAVVIFFVVFGIVRYHNNHSVSQLLSKAQKEYLERDYPDANAHLDRVFALDADNEDALLLSGQIDAAKKDYESAENDLQTVIAKNPSNQDAYAELLKIYDEQEKYDEILALKDGVTDENVLPVFEDYEIPSPQIGEVSGTYPEEFSVKITAPRKGLAIYYTLDGSVPTTGSTKYTEPVQISDAATLTAICADEDGNCSEPVFAKYTIGDDADEEDE